MKDKFKGYKSKPAQTILEYSLLIAVAVSALTLMQIYMSRSTQGHLKQTVDRLGSEHVTNKVFSPGSWFSGDTSSVQQRQTWGFDYEHGIIISFGISTGGSKITSASNMTGIAVPDALSFASLKAQPLLDDGEDAAFITQVQGSPVVTPQVSDIDANVGAGTKEWAYKYDTPATEAELNASFKQEIEEMSDKYKYVPAADEDTSYQTSDAEYKAVANAEEGIITGRNEGYAERERLFWLDKNK